MRIRIHEPRYRRTLRLADQVSDHDEALRHDENLIELGALRHRRKARDVGEITTEGDRGPLPPISGDPCLKAQQYLKDFQKQNRSVVYWQSKPD